jgi:hypothetical protein
MIYILESCWAPRKLQTQIEHDISLKNFNTARSYITNYYCKLVGEYRGFAALSLNEEN